MREPLPRRVVAELEKLWYFGKLKSVHRGTTERGHVAVIVEGETVDEHERTNHFVALDPRTHKPLAAWMLRTPPRPSPEPSGHAELWQDLDAGHRLKGIEHALFAHLLERASDLPVSEVRVGELQHAQENLARAEKRWMATVAERFGARVRQDPHKHATWIWKEAPFKVENRWKGHLLPKGVAER
jgi:hypothetical protein